jgi:hypothetical protein
MARALRPRGLANDLGLLAAHGVARGPRGADRDLDLPKSATTIAAVTHRKFRQSVRSATIWIATVWITVRIPAVTWTVGITVFRISRTIRH